MSLFDAVRGLLSGSGRAVGEGKETFEYLCRDCDSEFESAQPHVTTVRCPECGSEDVRVSDDPYRSK